MPRAVENKLTRRNLREAACVGQVAVIASSEEFQVGVGISQQCCHYLPPATGTGAIAHYFDMSFA